MSDRLYPHDDFEATIIVFGPEEGGRPTPVFNGIRWDFKYADDPSASDLYMIWPDFFAYDGQSLPSTVPLPVGEELSARMTIVVDEMRSKVHRSRMTPGVRFFCHEGPHRVAKGIVTRITGLFTPVTLNNVMPG